MHYLDALDALDHRASHGGGGVTDAEEDQAAESNAKRDAGKRKAQSLNVSVRGDSSTAASSGPSGSRNGPLDGREALMQADREAESEQWIDLDWSHEEVSTREMIQNCLLFSPLERPVSQAA